jgi:hypothetical protein
VLLEEGADRLEHRFRLAEVVGRKAVTVEVRRRARRQWRDGMHHRVAMRRRQPLAVRREMGKRPLGECAAVGSDEDLHGVEWEFCVSSLAGEAHALLDGHQTLAAVRCDLGGRPPRFKATCNGPELQAPLRNIQASPYL